MKYTLHMRTIVFREPYTKQSISCRQQTYLLSDYLNLMLKLAIRDGRCRLLIDNNLPPVVFIPQPKPFYSQSRVRFLMFVFSSEIISDDKIFEVSLNYLFFFSQMKVLCFYEISNKLQCNFVY